jgi:hypothetical protein
VSPDCGRYSAFAACPSSKSVVQIDYHIDFVHRRPATRARIYRALDEFINLHLYNYDVKIGPTRVVK